MRECKTSTAPNDSCPGATVEAELHEPVHQGDGQEVTAGNIIAVEESAIETCWLEDDLKLHKGQVALVGLGPGGASIRAHSLIEEGQSQQETWRIERGEQFKALRVCVWRGYKRTYS